ncbi:large conductance mechanosensitive channel protein MscL [Candidatus Thorarchaeota archaeon]|nr:MAG: large conductance mechanosensitive channel protein MscL [Candidatus Thorarchaeota archaeon]
MERNDEVLEELRNIRKLLEPPAPEPEPEGFIDEFKNFLSKYKVLGLAVAFILGIYIGNLVQALVNDLIMPVIEIFTGGVEWEDFAVGVFRIGHFAGTLLTFIIVAFVVFVIVKIGNRFGVK